MVYRAGSESFRFFILRSKIKTTGGAGGSGLIRILCLGRSADRAGFSAGAALDAGIGIDLKLAVAFADGGNGALGGTGAAADAFFVNLVSHRTNLLICLHAGWRDTVNGL